MMTDKELRWALRLSEIDFDPSPPRICGIGRVSDNEKVICLYFDRKLTDDELRSLHECIHAEGQKK